MLDRLDTQIQKTREQNKQDAEQFQNLDNDECMLCHARGEDKRGLFVSCLYAIKEVVPEALCLSEVPEWEGRSFYYLRICKNCRGEFLGMMREWRLKAIERRAVPKDSDGHPELHDGDIPVRVDGRIIHMTEEEWKANRDNDNLPEV